MVGAFPRPIARAARAALHHRHHAGRPADRRLQQDHRAEGVFRREARDHLFLARGRLEQEGQLHAGDRGRQRGDPPAARASPLYNLRGSAYYDKGEYDIAIADFNDALRIGPPSGIIFHNRGNAWRSKGEYAKAIADYDQAIKLGPTSAFSWQNRGISKQALGDLDGALADINEAIRLDPTLPQPLTNRAVIWRAKGDLDRAIADTTEAIRLAKAKAPVNIMTPPGSVLISAYTQRALAYEAKGDFDRAKQDYAATLEGKASDAGSKANQATAKVRLSLLSETLPPSPRTATAAPPLPASKAAPASPAGAASPSPPPAAEQRQRAETGREPAGASRW